MEPECIIFGLELYFVKLCCCRVWSDYVARKYSGERWDCVQMLHMNGTQNVYHFLRRPRWKELGTRNSHFSYFDPAEGFPFLCCCFASLVGFVWQIWSIGEVEGSVAIRNYAANATISSNQWSTFNDPKLRMNKQFFKKLRIFQHFRTLTNVNITVFSVTIVKEGRLLSDGNWWQGFVRSGLKVEANLAKVDDTLSTFCAHLCCSRFIPPWWMTCFVPTAVLHFLHFHPTHPVIQRINKPPPCRFWSSDSGASGILILPSRGTYSGHTYTVLSPVWRCFEMQFWTQNWFKI